MTTDTPAGDVENSVQSCTRDWENEARKKSCKDSRIDSQIVHRSPAADVMSFPETIVLINSDAYYQYAIASLEKNSVAK